MRTGGIQSLLQFPNTPYIFGIVANMECHKSGIINSFLSTWMPKKLGLRGWVACQFNRPGLTCTALPLDDEAKGCFRDHLVVAKVSRANLIFAPRVVHIGGRHHQDWDSGPGELSISTPRRTHTKRGLKRGHLGTDPGWGSPGSPNGSAATPNGSRWLKSSTGSGATSIRLPAHLWKPLA